MQKNYFYIIFTILLVGCASSPDEIPTAYVSPIKYADHDCEQLAMEIDGIARQSNQLYHSLKKKSDNDNAQMAVGMLLFWPTLFFLEGGDGADAAQYGQLKGELEAVNSAIIKKKCDIETEETIEELADRDY